MVSLLITQCVCRSTCIQQTHWQLVLLPQMWTDSDCMPAAAPAVLMAFWLQIHQLVHF